jgi:hypothetical protein
LARAATDAAIEERRMYRAELSGEILKMVGWLDGPQPFSQGTVSAEDIVLLEQLVLHTWKPPFMAGGWHDCTVCPRKPGDGPLYRQIDGNKTMLGAAEIYVPDGDIMYSAPNLILHYIEDHGYGPPEPFLVAVRRIDPTSPHYLQDCQRISDKAMAEQRARPAPVKAAADKPSLLARIVARFRGTKG